MLEAARIGKGIAESCMGKALGRQDRKGYYRKLERAGHRLQRYVEVLRQCLRHGYGNYEAGSHMDMKIER